jgi:hypothetical protein
MPMPPAIQTCRGLLRARWEKVPYRPLQLGRPSRREVHEHPGVVPEGLHRQTHCRPVWRRGDREWVGLASELRKPHEHELTRLEAEPVAFPGQDDLHRVLRQSVHPLDAVPVSADQQPPEQRPACERHEGQDGEQGEVDGEGPRTRLGAPDDEYMHAGEEEHDGDGPLDADEGLVPHAGDHGEGEPGEQPSQRDHPDEDPPPSSWSEQRPRGAPREQRPAEDQEQGVQRNQAHRHQSQEAVRPVRPIQAHEQPLDHAQTTPEHESHGERRRSHQRSDVRQALQRAGRGGEPLRQRMSQHPERERSKAEDGQGHPAPRPRENPPMGVLMRLPAATTAIVLAAGRTPPDHHLPASRITRQCGRPPSRDRYRTVAAHGWATISRTITAYRTRPSTVIQ